MNRLYGEFFREFSGVISEVCETIWGSFWICFGRISEEKLFKKQENSKNLVLLVKIALDTVAYLKRVV